MEIYSTTANFLIKEYFSFNYFRIEHLKFLFAKWRVKLCYAKMANFIGIFDDLSQKIGVIGRLEIY
ncbi:MAG: hypothetical protein CME10_05615 [Gemmatimonadetes bacterium]|nr:hypothetical protein [Gemmatimonadota bacterium]